MFILQFFQDFFMFEMFHEKKKKIFKYFRILRGIFVNTDEMVKSGKEHSL